MGDIFEIWSEKLETFNTIVVADGSGTTLDRPCGWCCKIVTKDGTVKTITGGASCGTNNFAELTPFLTFLWLLTSRRDSVQWYTYTKPKLAFISDSEVTVRCAKREYARNANLGLWASLDYYDSIFDISWFWIPRCSTEVHKICDRLAGLTRKTLEGLAHENCNTKN